MNRFLQRVFVVLAVAFAAFAGLLVKSFQLEGIPILAAKTFYVSIFCAVFFLLAAFKFKTEWKFRLFMLVLCLALLECVLQAMAWTGVLPGVNTKLKSPYSRVYWTAEGRGNSIRNRFGWYYPKFDLQASRRIAAIGDSLVEAVEVLPTRNNAYLLQQRLRAESPDSAVYGLGCHGAAPSYYPDVIEYAQKYLKPTEVIIYVSMGSDITESSPVLNSLSPAYYIYYDLDAQGRLVLNPGSAACREGAIHVMEMSQRPLLFSLPTTLSSHCMIVQALASVRDTFARRALAAAKAKAAQLSGTNAVGAETYEATGLNLAPFAVDPVPEVKHAMQVLEAELEWCKKICDGYGIRFRLVTIPVFPQLFYRTQQGRDWTTKIGQYDFFGPERELAAFAQARNIPLCSVGSYLQSKKMDPAEIRRLYFSNGTGHFTEAGHQLCAEAVYQAFYLTKQP